jgi:DNA-binding transcriptional MocR family regulator
LNAACEAYAARRQAAARAIGGAKGCSAWEGLDGVNIWVHLPPETDANNVIEQAAALGVIVAPGEPFFIRPGRSDVVRLNAGAVSATRAAEVGRMLATAVTTATPTSSDVIPV